MNNNRKQLTLFLDQPESVEIEKVRRKYNPEQAVLIHGHITLCREDEIIELEQVISNITTIDQKFFSLEIGRPVLFNNGKGVFLPVIGNRTPFDNLRAKILEGIIQKPRVTEPHITLIHPRNGICNDEIFNSIQQYHFPTKIHFKDISLIEEINGRNWKVIERFDLKK